LFYDLIEIRVISRIRALGMSIAGLIIIIAWNRNSRRSNSLMLFYDLLETRLHFG
jgi:hypothetical protein